MGKQHFLQIRAGMVGIRYGLLLSGLFLCAAAAEAAEIHGTVSDAQGAAIAGAKVGIANNSRRGPRRGEATTGHDGTYAITGLEPGLYTVTASAPSEKISLRRQIVIRSESNSVEANFQLPVTPPRNSAP